jgi:hypothetical protein
MSRRSRSASRRGLMAPRASKPHAKRAARAHINNVALKALRAQAHGWPVTVTLHGRAARKLRGRIAERRRIEGFKETGADGESNLEIVIDGEAVALMRVADIQRQRLASSG